MGNMRSTVVYATIRIERHGKSGPENERKIEKYLESIAGDNPKDKYMEVEITGHPYETFTETI